ncbi:MAG: hypothetical protein E6G76_02410 [Alphaproteobacteria bacterium]|nr:MAG: hypothetical protein E6G76_02410 [Alphaproteobacteria bacterium]
MPRTCTLAIAMAALGVLSALPATRARACDNDRYPCPIVAQPQDTASTAARPPAPSRNKASRAARQDDKPRAKPEGEASRDTSYTTKVNPAAAQERAIVSSPRTSEDPAPARNEVAREESPVAAAAAASPVPPASAAAGAQATAADATPPVAAANEVRVVDPNELNELDVAAASAAPAGSAESSWLSYLLMTLGGALAAASTVRFLFFV